MIFLWTSVVCFRLLLEVAYYSYVAEFFGYQGYSAVLSPVNYLLSWILFIGNISLLRKELKSVKDFFYIYFICFLLIPMYVLFGYDDTRSVVPVIYANLTLITVNSLLRIRLLRVKQIVFSNRVSQVYIGIVLLVTLMTAVWYQVSGSTLNFNIADVYAYRQNNSDMANVGILAYTNSWVYSVFNIILFAFCLHKKKLFWATFFFGLQIFFFGATGHKGLVLYTLMPLGFYLLRPYIVNSVTVPLSLSLLVLVAWSVEVYDDGWSIGLIVRRAFILPADLVFDYFVFFERYPKVYWSNSFGNIFLDYPYGETVGRVIGDFRGEPNMNANSGFLSMGYAHAGGYGVLLYSIVLAICLRITNWVVKDRVPIWIVGSVVSIPIINVITSTDLTVVLVTHGLVLLVLSMFILRFR